MRVAVLSRYPHKERSPWKRRIVEQLIAAKYEVSLIFGDSTFWRQLNAGLKLYGPAAFSRTGGTKDEKGPLLKDFFKNKINVFRMKDLNSRSTELILDKLKPDILLLLGTGIIRKNILTIPVVGTVHCHQGYLPDYRGVNTLEWSLFYGHDIYLTTHFVDPGIDTGAILLRRKISLDRIATLSELRKSCREEAVSLILDTITGIREKKILPQTQENEKGRQYFAMHPYFLEIVGKKLQKSATS